MKIEQKEKYKREALVNAALQEFSKKPYEQASLNAILKGASVTKGAFYYSFKDKLDLYTQILKDASLSKLSYFVNEVGYDNMIQPDDSSLFEYMKQMISVAIGFTNAYPDYHDFDKMFQSECEEFRAMILGQEGLNSYDYLIPMIDKSFENGNIDSYYSLEFVQAIATYMLTHYSDIINYANKPEEELRGDINMFFTFMERGFSKGVG